MPDAYFLSPGRLARRRVGARTHETTDVGPWPGNRRASHFGAQHDNKP